MLTYDVELVDLEPQATAVVHGHVKVAELPAFIGAAFAEVMQALASQQLQPVGPPFGRYRVCSDGFDAEVGFPATGEVAATGRVRCGHLPGGPAARILHQGPYSTVAGAYDEAQRWLDTRGYVETGPPWEEYLDGPEVPEPRTLVYVPCRVR